MRRGYVDHITDHPYSLDNDSDDYGSQIEQQLRQMHPGLRGHLLQQQFQDLDLGSEYYSEEGEDGYDTEEDRTIDLFLDGGDLIQHMQQQHGVPPDWQQ